jgi:hypothetical protein
MNRQPMLGGNGFAVSRDLNPNLVRVASLQPLGRETRKHPPAQIRKKSLPKQCDIVEEIVDHLGPLSCSRGKALADVDRHIDLFRRIVEQKLPDATTVREAARSLSNALALFGDSQPVPLDNCERPYVTIREIRSACGLLQGIDGPSSKFDQIKWHCASFAYSLIRDFSKASRSVGVRLPGADRHRNIAGLLYKAIYGRRMTLKRQCAAVRKWRRS